MTNWLAAALFGIYALITLVTPAVLARPVLVDRHPTSVLWGWVLSLLLAGASLLLALGILIQRSLRHEVDGVPNGVWLAPLVDTVLGWLSIAALGIILFRLGVAVSEMRASSRAAQLRLAVITSSGEPAPAVGMDALRVVSDIPLVGTVSSTGSIFFTSELEKVLTPDQLGAALEHERAHLRGRHAQLRMIASLAVAVAPLFRSTQEMARATRIATELAADDAATRTYGPSTVAEALSVSFPNEDFISERVQRLTQRAGG